MDDKVVDILKSVGAVITDDHFVYTSGKHGSVYINKDALYPHIKQTSQVCRLMAEKFADQGIEVVAGPALGGIILSEWVAYHLGQIKGKPILSVYAEKDGDNQVFRRGYDALIKDKKVLVVEDLTTTGGSVRKVVDRVKEAGGEVVGVVVMVNRDPVQVTEDVVGAPLVSAGILRAEAFAVEDCPLCKKGVPINTEVGHGREYLKGKSK
jgi:orotate phosphoribosyltransferase